MRIKEILFVCLILLAAAFSASAQDQPGQRKFPDTGIDSRVTLFETRDNPLAHLGSSISPSAITITVASGENTDGFPATGALLIDAEIIYYNSKTSTQFLGSFGLMRGRAGTTAASHTAGAVIRSPNLSVLRDTLLDALIATQSKLGWTNLGGNSTPALGKFLKSTGTGQSSWEFITANDIPSTINSNLSNPSSVSINADNLATGTGRVSFKTRGIERLGIENDGTVGVAGAMNVSGSANITGVTTAPLLDKGGTVANVMAFGGDNSGLIPINSTVISAINALPSTGGTVLFPTGTYLLTSAIPYNLKSNITFEFLPGAKLVTSTPGLAFFNFSGTNVVENISWDGMTIDADATTSAFLTGIALSTDSLRGRARISNCQFIGHKLVGVSSANSVVGVTIERSLFHGRGNGTMRAIDFTNAGSRNITIQNNRFEYVEAGITIGGVPRDTQGYNLAQNINISGNYFDQGWWSLVEDYSGNATATSTTSLTDAGANFSNITTGAVLRAMVQTTSASGTYAQNIITNMSASFTTTAKRGYIVRSGSAFALVADVQSDTQIRVEQWLSNTTRLPVNVPAAGTTYTLYEPRIAIVSSVSSTALTFPRWITLGTGATASTPASNVRYEISKNLPVQMLQISSQLSNVIDNQLRRGMGDQLTLGGNDNNVIGNLIEDGQDMGITVDSGSKNNIIGNIIRRQGAHNILLFNGASGNLVQGNSLSDAGLIVPSSSAVANVFLLDAKDNTIGNNYMERVNSTHTAFYAAIVNGSDATKPSSGNRISNNTVKGHTVSQQFVASGTQVSNTKFILTSGIATYGNGATNTTVHEVLDDGRLRITKATPDSNYNPNQSAIWLTHTGDDTSGTAIADATSYGFVQSYGGRPLRLNPAGNSVEIGPAGSATTVDGTTGALKPAGILFANLGTPQDGTVQWCSNCNISTPCTGGGSGAWAFRSNGVWKCPF